METKKYGSGNSEVQCAVELQKVTEEQGITNKVAALVTANTSNMVAVIRITGWTHIHYFAHTLNLVIQEVIKGDLDLLLMKKKCKDIVTFFTIVLMVHKS